MRGVQKRVVYNLKALMEKRELSIGTLAAESEIDKSYLSKILRGERRMNLEHFEDLVKALHIDPADLLKPS
jgi:transcriptional regulator with XRE-family HTH domain